MKVDVTFYILWPLGLFAASILCILLTRWFPRRKIVLSLLTALFSVIGMICAFVMGASLQELLIPFLVLLWLSLRIPKSVEDERK